VNVDGKEVTDNSFLSRYISSKPPGSSVKVSVLRSGKEQPMTIVLGTFPDDTSEETSSENEKSSLGMTPKTLTPSLAEQLELPRTAKGVVVTEVEPGEAADDAGLQRGDVIVSVGGVEVDDVDSFKKEIDKARKDGLARLRVRRGGTHFFVVLKLS